MQAVLTAPVRLVRRILRITALTAAAAALLLILDALLLPEDAARR